MRKTINNIIFVVEKTWKHEKMIVIIVLLQILIRISIPLFTVYLPTIILNGVYGLITIQNMFSNIVFFLIFLTFCNCMNAYIGAVFDTYLLNNKIHFLTDLFRTKMELDYSFIESPLGQNMYQYTFTILLNDNQGITGILRILGTLLGNICSVLLYIGMIAKLSIEIVLVILFTSVVHLIILKKFLNKQDSKKESWVDLDRKINYISSYISNAKNNKDIKIFSMQGWLTKVINILVYDRIKWVKTLAKYDFIVAMADIGLLIIRDIVAYLFIFQAIYRNEIEISQFVFYFGIITNFSAFMTEISSNMAYIFQRSREISAFRDYIDQEKQQNQEKEHLEEIQLLDKDATSIKFVNVSFRFNEKSPYILKNINLEIKEGEKIALVGENGAGKTTLVKLICGFYKPTVGKILVNGIDINKLTKSSIAKIFAAVFQDIHILPMSVGENIAFGEVNNCNKEIEQCIRIAGLEDVFDNIHMPVTKIFNEKGIILSGGQGQKLILARAAYKLLYKGALVLILDEPTAALDPIAEKQFYEKYQKLTNNKISIFISHRLSSTQFCDKIFVLDGGEIEEVGTHKQLMKKNGKYKELYDIQSKYYK